MPTIETHQLKKNGVPITPDKVLASNVIVGNTDLNGALNQKQNQLVSGRTIATVNGHDLLAGGDIIIPSGESSIGTLIDVTNNGFYLVDSNLYILLSSTSPACKKALVLDKAILTSGSKVTPVEPVVTKTLGSITIASGSDDNHKQCSAKYSDGTAATNVTWSLNSTTYATIDSSTGIITIKSAATSNQSITVTAKDNLFGSTLSQQTTVKYTAPSSNPTYVDVTPINSTYGYSTVGEVYKQDSSDFYIRYFQLSAGDKVKYQADAVSAYEYRVEQWTMGDSGKWDGKNKDGQLADNTKFDGYYVSIGFCTTVPTKEITKSASSSSKVAPTIIVGIDTNNTKRSGEYTAPKNGYLFMRCTRNATNQNNTTWYCRKETT